jgi:AcrR family transcriptional regulator
LVVDKIRSSPAALALADDHGLEGLAMAAVAERLEVTPMALYRHVANKADLLDGLVERLLTEFPPRPAELAWPERACRLASCACRLNRHRDCDCSGEEVRSGHLAQLPVPSVEPVARTVWRRDPILRFTAGMARR